MANIKVVVKTHEEGTGLVDNIQTNIQTNNVSALKNSNDIISWVRTLDSDNLNYAGAKAIPLGLFKLNATSFLGIKNSNDSPASTYNGIILGYTNAYNLLNLTLTLLGSNLGELKIIFDPFVDNYPTTYTISEDGGTPTTHSNSSNVLEITDISRSSSEVVIAFTSWSKPNAMVGITFIENKVIEREFYKDSILSLETESELTSNPQTALTGVLANTGSVKLKDKNNILYHDANLGYLQMNTFGAYSD